MPSLPWVTATAPGRVNLMGDHTDHTGGRVLPMAIDRSTVVAGAREGRRVVLTSTSEPLVADVPLAVDDPAAVEPAWARYVAGVVAVLRPATGLDGGRVASTVPIGGGLGSSAALEVALALALGFTGSPLELARACQEAEHRASGVPCGIMDPLASAAAVAGHALLIDCTTLDVTPVPLPDEVEVVVVDSGVRRALTDSQYALRRAQCEAVQAVVGPLAQARLADLGELDGIALRRARHVVTENARVLEFADALRCGDLAGAGALMFESHRSLRDDFEVSVPALDDLVEALRAAPGVWGARLTGAGFGGHAVALARPGALTVGTPVRPSGPAAVVVSSG